jgi:hypothetical protein
LSCSFCLQASLSQSRCFATTQTKNFVESAKKTELHRHFVIAQNPVEIFIFRIFKASSSQMRELDYARQQNRKVPKFPTPSYSKDHAVFLTFNFDELQRVLQVDKTIIKLLKSILSIVCCAIITKLGIYKQFFFFLTSIVI